MCLAASMDDVVVSLDEEGLAVVLLAPSNGCAGPAVTGRMGLKTGAWALSLDDEATLDTSTSLSSGIPEGHGHTRSHAVWTGTDFSNLSHHPTCLISLMQLPHPPPSSHRITLLVPPTLLHPFCMYLPPSPSPPPSSACPSLQSSRPSPSSILSLPLKRNCIGGQKHKC